MNKKDTYRASDKCEDSRNVSDTHQGRIGAGDKVVLKHIKAGEDVEEGKILFLIAPDFDSDGEFDGIWYRFFTQVVYLVSIMVVVFCLFS